MNALYCTSQGAVFDPLGGLEDLVGGRVRFIGAPEDRIREDYLRILRFFRFNGAYGRGEPDKAGMLACVRLRRELIRLSAERIHAELVKLLLTSRAVDMIRIMFNVGLLTDIVGGVPYLGKFERMIALETVCGIAANAARRLSALAISVEEDADRLALRLRLSKAEQLVVRAGIYSGQGISPSSGEAAARAALYRFGADAYGEQVLHAWARSEESPEDPGWKRLFGLRERWAPPSLPLTGAILLELGLPAGPHVGQLLREIEKEWIAEDFTWPPEEFIKRAKSKISER
jgi:tRNA nucleotidyltransferase/poly(A) polymerase